MRKTSAIIWQDKQHQVLFDVLDHIKSGNAGPQELDKLRAYADNHFAIEEEYMAVLNYPHREQHIKAHDKFRAEFKTMVDPQYSMDRDFHFYLGTFLTEWLLRHVFGIDKELEEFIQESESK